MDLLAEKILIIIFKVDRHSFPIEIVHVLKNYRTLTYRKNITEKAIINVLIFGIGLVCIIHLQLLRTQERTALNIAI